MRSLRIPSLLAAIALVATACSTGTGGSPAPSTIAAVGDGEGKVSVLAWPGYVEDGTTLQLSTRLDHPEFALAFWRRDHSLRRQGAFSGAGAVSRPCDS